MEAQTILGTAASTYRNAALAAPWFLQAALIALPLFIIAWIAHSEIMNRIAPDAKKRPLAMKAWLFLCFALWAAFGAGSFSALRESASLVELAAPIILFFATWGATNAAVKLGSVPATGLGKWPRIVGVIALIVLVGLAGARNWMNMFLPMSALIGGFLTGFYSARYSVPNARATYAYPVATSSIIMLLIAACILLQPELFRFGQLGNLDFAQLAGFAFIAIVAPMTMVLSWMVRVKRDKGFLGATAHARVMWLMRLGVLLCAVLFFITESIVMFCILALSAAVFAAISGGHQPYSNAKSVNAFIFDIWCMLLAVFGLVAASPAVMFLALIMWRETSHRNLLDQSKRLL